jgi:nitrogen fixation protein FixH
MPTLSKDTKITLGAAVVVVKIAVAATWWAGVQFNNLKADSREQFNALNAQIATLTERAAGSYTLAAASEQALRMAIENPGLRVPDPRDPSKVITASTSTPYRPNHSAP